MAASPKTEVFDAVLSSWYSSGLATADERSGFGGMLTSSIVLWNQAEGHTYWSPRVLRWFVWPDRAKPSLHIELRGQSDHSTRSVSLLSVVSYLFGSALASRSQTPELAGWSEWLEDIVVMADDLHPLDDLDFTSTPFDGHVKHLRRTPLQWFLLGAESVLRNKLVTAPGTWRRHMAAEMDRILRTWVQTLHKRRVELNQYGKIEAGFLRDHTVLRNERWWSCRCFSYDHLMYAGPELKAISYGGEHGDWRLLWDMDTEEFAGDFWHLAENVVPLPRVPGAWVDD